MALYDSADLLARCKVLFNRPTTDEALDDTLHWYTFLGYAQQRVVSLVAFHCPEAMYGAPTKLVTADSGATYTFGTDADANNISPVGHVEIRESPTGAMIPPASAWDNTTLAYLFESDKIRWPGQKSRTFTDGPYARFVTMPGLLNASVAPTLKPIFARELCVYDACERAAVRIGADPTPYGQMFDVRFPEILQMMLTSFHGSGALATQGGSDVVWWRGMTG